MQRPAANISMQVEQLERSLQETIDPQEQLELLINLSMLSINSDVNNADGFARRAYRLAMSNNDTYWAGKACLMLGGLRTMRSQYDSAYRYFKKAWSYLKEYPECYEEKVDVFRSLGLILAQHRGDTYGSLRMYRLAQSYADKSGNPKAQTSLLIQVAEAYCNLGLYELAVDTLEKTVQIVRVHPNDPISAYAEWLLGSICIRFEFWQEARQRLTHSLALYRKVAYKGGEAVALRELGILLYHEGRQRSDRHLLRESLSSLHESKQLYAQLDNRLLLGTVLMDISSVHIQQGEFQRAMQCCEEALSHVESVGNAVAAFQVNIAKAHVLIEMKNWEQAIAVLKSIENMWDGISIELRILLSQRLAVAYEATGNVQASLLYNRKWVEIDREIVATAVQRKLMELEFRETSDRSTEAKEVRGGRDQPQSSLNEKELFSAELRKRTDILEKLREQILELADHSADKGTVASDILQTIDRRNEGVKVWELFEQQLVQLNFDIVNSIRDRYPKLTPTEFRTCLLLRMNLSNKEIACLLNLSDRTIDTHRTNIRRKMGLKNKENLVAVISAL